MIDERAVIDPSAQIDADVTIGPYAVIGPDVEIAAGTWVGPHAVINGPTRIGRDNKIYQFVSLGEAPQDKKYAGELTRLEIGDRNVIREYCTFNRGTVQDVGVTRIGDDNWIMAYVHIAHDCQIGNYTVFANNASLAGHCVIEDHVILGGFTLVHQFCRLGMHCFTAFNSGIAKDIPPYVMAAGYSAKPHGLNVEGMKRRGVSLEKVRIMKKAYKLIYRSNLTLVKAVEAIEPLTKDCDEVQIMRDFLQKSQRGIIR
ncbi:Acyl-[acyl-carrier-protein]--UDP-N-acetylglucosamine O-acyltransferase [hydrothermal vent metagenome]|uniref:Acyl-[acyl-carrier-protein]--UDP-N-acetylglucosamine O-acyltransferase n=1 Tax=hydrothermal vent metagenome TaxID=652676 RepID=A0A3B0ZAC2_9ZZZZ